MKPDAQAGFLMAKIHQTSGRLFARLLRERQIEINPAQGRILFALWQSDGIPIQELAKRTALGKSTLTSMLDRLEAAGLLRREPSPTDRRQILIKRTDKDRAMQAEYEAVSREMNTLYFLGFDETRIRRFETDLKEILNNLEQEEQTPRRAT